MANTDKNKPNISMLIDWIDSPRSNLTLDRLKPPINLKWVKPDELPSLFGALLCHYLAKSGYDLSQPDVADRLAHTIGHWQDPEREIPFHPLLVKSWLDGAQVMPHEAFEGVLHYLQQTNTISEPAAAAFEALYEKIELKMTQTKPFYMAETTQTARALIDATGLTQADLARRYGIKQSAISPYYAGANAFSLYQVIRFDAILSSLGLNGLTSGHLIRHCFDAGKALDNAESFGPMLIALREYLFLNQSNFGSKVGVSAAMQNYWENEIIKDGENYPCCPSEYQMKEILEIASARDVELKEQYGDDYVPLLNPARIKNFERAATILRSDRNTFKKTNQYTPEILQEIAVLRDENLPYKAIAGLLKLQSSHAANNTFNASEYRRRPLTDEEYAGVGERLAARGIELHHTRSTSIGAVHRGIEPKATRQR